MSASQLDVKNQLAQCGITCGTCDLGNGTAANAAKNVLELINGIGIKDWSPMVPGGSELDWEATERTLDWMTKYAYCAGCEKVEVPLIALLGYVLTIRVLVSATSVVTLRDVQNSTGSVNIHR